MEGGGFYSGRVVSNQSSVLNSGTDDWKLETDNYTANSGRFTTGSNFQTYLYMPLKKSIVIS